MPLSKCRQTSPSNSVILRPYKSSGVNKVCINPLFARRIAELTEDLEELRSEKAVLLQQMQFPEDATADSFRKEIRTLEAGLKKLETSEARQTIRSGHEQSAIQRVQDAYGDKYNLLMMFESRRDVSELLNEEMEARSLRERLRQKQRRQKTDQQRKPKHHEQER